MEDLDFCWVDEVEPIEVSDCGLELLSILDDMDRTLPKNMDNDIIGRRKLVVDYCNRIVDIDVQDKVVAYECSSLIHRMFDILWWCHSDFRKDNRVKKKIKKKLRSVKSQIEESKKNVINQEGFWFSGGDTVQDIMEPIWELIKYEKYIQ